MTASTEMQDETQLVFELFHSKFCTWLLETLGKKPTRKTLYIHFTEQEKHMKCEYWSIVSFLDALTFISLAQVKGDPRHHWKPVSILSECISILLMETGKRPEALLLLPSESWNTWEKLKEEVGKFIGKGIDRWKSERVKYAADFVDKIRPLAVSPRILAEGVIRGIRNQEHRAFFISQINPTEGVVSAISQQESKDWELEEWNALFDLSYDCLNDKTVSDGFLETAALSTASVKSDFLTA